MAMTRESGTTQKHSPRFATRISRRVGEGTKNVIARLGTQTRRDMGDAGFVQLSKILTVIGAVLLGIIAAPIALNLIAGQMPAMVGATNNITTAFKTADWGDDTANSLSPTVGMMVSLVSVFAIAALAFGAWYVVKSKSSH